MNKRNIRALASRVVADGTVKLRIRCVAYPETSAHYANAVLVSATSLVLSLDGVADTSFSGGSGTLLFATYTTLGALCDQINSSGNWEAEIVAGLRTDAVDGSELLARGTSVFRMYQEVDIYADSSDSGVFRLAILLEPNRPFDTVHGLDSMQVYHQNRVALKRVKALINTSDAGAWDLTIYELKPGKAAAYKTLYNATPADNTEQDTGLTDNVLCQAEFGNSLLVVASDAAFADAGAYVQVEGELEQPE